MRTRCWLLVLFTMWIGVGPAAAWTPPCDAWYRSSSTAAQREFAAKGAYRMFLGLDDPTLNDAEQTWRRNLYRDELVGVVLGEFATGQLSTADPTAGWGGALQHTLGALTLGDLGTLLRDQGPPGELAHQDNYYAKVSQPTETKLQALVAESGGGLTPADLMRLSLQAADHNYVMALLAAHNYLKNIAYKGRGMSNGRQQILSADLMQAQGYGYVMPGVERLVNLRANPAQADKMGPWYHIFGVMFLGSITSRQVSGGMTWAEQFTRTAGRFFGATSYSPVDPVKKAWDDTAIEAMKRIHDVIFSSDPPPAAPKVAPSLRVGLKLNPRVLPSQPVEGTVTVWLNPAGSVACLTTPMPVVVRLYLRDADGKIRMADKKLDMYQKPVQGLSLEQDLPLTAPVFSTSGPLRLECEASFADAPGFLTRAAGRVEVREPRVSFCVQVKDLKGTALSKIPVQLARNGRALESEASGKDGTAHFADVPVPQGAKTAEFQFTATKSGQPPARAKVKWTGADFMPVTLRIGVPEFHGPGPDLSGVWDVTLEGMQQEVRGKTMSMRWEFWPGGTGGVWIIDESLMKTDLPGAGYRKAVGKSWRAMMSYRTDQRTPTYRYGAAWPFTQTGGSCNSMTIENGDIKGYPLADMFTVFRLKAVRQGKGP